MKCYYQRLRKEDWVNILVTNVETFANDVIDMVDNIQRAMNGENQFEHLVLSDKQV